MPRSALLVVLRTIKVNYIKVLFLSVFSVKVIYPLYFPKGNLWWLGSKSSSPLELCSFTVYLLTYQYITLDKINGNKVKNWRSRS